MLKYGNSKQRFLVLSYNLKWFIRSYKKPSNLISKILQPINIIPKNAHVKSDDISSKSQKLMLDLGFIRQALSPGTFCLLPFGYRSLQKLIRIVDREMNAVNAQKILLPTLTAGDLWKTSGRWKASGPELFRLQDRHKQDLVVSPTHEEAITEMIASLGNLSYRQFPILLYQISSKFRDEAKPRSGLLRAREFIMKDLYSFDIDLECAKSTYKQIRDAYHRIFSLFDIKYLTVQGDATSMGGSASEEFHMLAEVGEDHLVICTSCGNGSNSELLSDSKVCPKCGSTDLKLSNGIEVGHCFILGTRYSAILDANFLNKNGKPEVLHMGCHGLGLSRILAAVAECLSTQEELRWPLTLAPYSICIITPKEGSKEIAATENAINLYNELNSIHQLEDDVLIDDRTSLTIGRRYRDANRTGFPFIVIAGKSTVGTDPVFELHETITGGKYEFKLDAVLDFIKHKISPIVR